MAVVNKVLCILHRLTLLPTFSHRSFISERELFNKNGVLWILIIFQQQRYRLHNPIIINSIYIKNFRTEDGRRTKIIQSVLTSFIISTSAMVKLNKFTFINFNYRIITKNCMLSAFSLLNFSLSLL